MQSSAADTRRFALFNANYSQFINLNVCIEPANDEKFSMRNHFKEEKENFSAQ
jgi:hypothetical protein